MWSEYQTAVKRAWASNQIDAQDTSVIFYDQDGLNQILTALSNSFSGRQSVAIKTCPIPAVLKIIAEKGFALEAASMEEVRFAKSENVGAEHIIFDSPVKTRQEIAAVAGDPNMLLNCNSLEELGRIPAEIKCQVGLRINPLVDLDNPDGFNVSKAESKFGVPISEKDRILEAFSSFEWLTALHMHIGSGVGEIENHLEAVQTLVDLATEVNTARQKKGLPRIQKLNIGGGLKSMRSTTKNIELLQRYADALEQVPGINQFELITEFGQLIHGPNGFVLSRVEYVRQLGEVQQVFLHVGADLFTRNVYSNLGNKLSFAVLDGHGEFVTNIERPTQLVGPLCFAGDEMGNELFMPEVAEDQYIMISNSVANTYGLWSRHCSRDVPKILLYSNVDETICLAEGRKQVW